MVAKKLCLMVVVVLLVLPTLTEARDPVGTFKIHTSYLDDTPFDPDTDVLDIGESLYLSIYAEEEFFWESGFGYFWALVCDPSLATITGGEIGPDADSGNVNGSVIEDGLTTVSGDGRWGWLGYEWPECMFDPGLYLDNFLYSPQSVGDVTVSFFDLSGSDWPLPVVGFADSVLITQVPEPMTIALLGLGVLFLSRRKHKQD